MSNNGITVGQVVRITTTIRISVVEDEAITEVAVIEATNIIIRTLTNDMRKKKVLMVKNTNPLLKDNTHKDVKEVVAEAEEEEIEVAKTQTVMEVKTLM